ncbi:MAG: molybdenum cofactor guanylyltransferase [Acidobacteria bacterium]|nr:molybdenum cofactor guanylyltransferase [Acidobacteriota bacterium]
MESAIPSRAGFVLAGGRSSRMGVDKALLPYRGATLVEHVARAVAAAAGSVALVGSPERYGGLGFPVLADKRPGEGPLAGIETALTASAAHWNLIVACDMPELGSRFLASLLEAAESSGADCLIPEGGSGMPEPLCAVYHLRCLPAVTQALDRGVRRVNEAILPLRVERRPIEQSQWFQNVNTPLEWTPYRHG